MMLQRLTTEFVDVEDRLRLSGQDANGHVQVLWLTQRLLNRLCPALCDMLERAGKGPHAGLMQGFEQEAARARHEPQEPVRVPEQASSWLVQAVDVTPTADGYLLRFRGTEEGREASVLLPDTALRQWLSIVREHYHRGGWPAAIWPEWMDPAGAPMPAGVMH